MKLNWRHVILLSTASFSTAVSLTACGDRPQPAARPEWNLLIRGDYLREEYIRAVCEGRSPLKAWRKVEGMNDEALQQITIGTDKNGVSLSAGYNFHEGSGPFSPAENGTLQMDEGANGANGVYSIDIKNQREFVLSNGKSEMRFQYVGDWQPWANAAVIAGTYEDKHGSKFVFQEDGQARFPGNLTFDYKVGLDMVMSSYDYIYSDRLKSTWAVVRNPNGVTLYDVDLRGNDPEGIVSAKPRWQLKRLTPNPCPSATQ